MRLARIARQEIGKKRCVRLERVSGKVAERLEVPMPRHGRRKRVEEAVTVSLDLHDALF